VIYEGKVEIVKEKERRAEIRVLMSLIFKLSVLYTGRLHKNHFHSGPEMKYFSNTIFSFKLTQYRVSFRARDFAPPSFSLVGSKRAKKTSSKKQKVLYKVQILLSIYTNAQTSHALYAQLDIYIQALLLL